MKLNTNDLKTTSILLEYYLKYPHPDYLNRC
jgi:hypothetical protein